MITEFESYFGPIIKASNPNMTRSLALTLGGNR